MADYIVLVKQVPDVSQITDNAFDPGTGTLMRNRLASVINELDTQALAMANHMKMISGDSAAKIVCLTMGPPMAEEVLRYSLARCADAAVLLTDKKLGGADTWATANPLSFAIQKIAKEILNDEKDYFVLSGMQSVDGDTAQVPGQVAEELGLPCVAYATDAEFVNKRFEFKRIISGGSEVVTLRHRPAVITVAKYEYPLFATFARSRSANHTKIIQWGADDINATSIGASGSKTAVIRVFPPGKSTRKCQKIESPAELAKAIKESFENENGQQDKSAGQAHKYVLPENRPSIFERNFEGLKKDAEDFEFLCESLRKLGVSSPAEIDDYLRQKVIGESNNRIHKKSLEDMLNGLNATAPSFNGDVWVVAEHSDGKIHPAAFELVGKARELADSLQKKVGVVLAGNGLDDMTDELIWAGADNVYVVEDKLLEQFDPTAYRKVISECILKYKPQIVLFAATPQGRMLAPMVSYRCQCGLTADCTSLEIRDRSRLGQIAVLMQTRPALGGNVMATIVTKNSVSQMATARPGVMKRLAEDKNRKGNVIEEKFELSENDLSLEIIRTEKGTGKAGLDSKVIVSGGKGMQNRDNYYRLLNTLCESLKDRLNTTVEKGASRAAVEQGFAERIVQVGQTGTSVGPRLYIAVGISGAIQHMIGVANTETIVAINSDPAAPIFKQCDYYVVGNAEDVIPRLVQALEKE
ncbi:MAG: FAD-binding protein [Phycisphaerae bacterium]|jgi:electron transfer flavoprotein alpha subunit